MTLRIALDNSYARLPDRFFARLDPTPVAAPGLVRVNAGLARDLGIDPDALAGAEGLAMFAGNWVPEGAEPLAMAYSGHQFGHFSPQLGDGRAILLGEVAGRDVQLKGSGPTPFSRRGDGRAALGPVLREYIVSEAMFALGVPTTRALAAVTTGEWVMRETALPGAVLTRVAASHLRVGTFQYFAARGDIEGLHILADYAIARHDPGASHRSFFEGVVRRQARLVAQWLSLGFIHGVMNTDNCSISGETIDYGPCAFLDTYDPAAVFSAIDYQGRYAFGQQPRIAQWNLARLAEAMLPLFDADEQKAVAYAEDALGGFAPEFQGAYGAAMRRKLGLATSAPEDAALVQDLLTLMAETGADFTLTFRGLGDDVVPEGFEAWAARWRDRRASEPGWQALIRATNPAVIPRNHLVEAAIVAAVEREDFSVFEALLAATSRPFDDADTAVTAPPLPAQRVTQTFCGT
ncbi:YdiU family protein [Roseomonas arctica]|uniref:Protein nucleotidyltransferase YdiU n=2 Tax=Plastoroseomonas arctica TaxID=1509237 RepID=A0AAF1KU32_9PROT|nr:YdiU family protein [Plastoroseomonas arctica]